MELDELLYVRDIVSLHCPLYDGTRGRLDARRLGLLRHGAIVINTARAGLFDEAEMHLKLRADGLRLGLDCSETDPCRLNRLAWGILNALLMARVGGTTDGGLHGMAIGAANNILKALSNSLQESRYDHIA
jgi:D-3-phosphoglycerate dehydrogenase